MSTYVSLQVVTVIILVIEHKLRLLSGRLIAMLTVLLVTRPTIIYVYSYLLIQLKYNWI